LAIALSPSVQNPKPVTYQVLARKYRPRSFADVVGQDNVVQTLGRALSSGRIAHAYLFTGSRGVGKTTLARIMARCLGCEKGPTVDPCGACPVCMALTNGSAVDLMEIDGASNTGIDQIRELQEMARFLPQMARFKIFIIDEVHMLTTSAFNALLKILEEPPPHLKFIFATTEPHKIPVTVLSRCQRYDFRRIPVPLIVGRLRQVLATEKLAIDDAGLDAIARAADGGMRDALSLCDQAISFCGASADRVVGVEDVVAALGLIDSRTIAQAVLAVLAGDVATSVTIVERAFSQGHDLKLLLSSMAEQLRHISVSQAIGTIAGHADLAIEDAARIDGLAKAHDPRDVVRLVGMLLEGLQIVTRSEQPRIATEWVLLRMCRRAPIGDALMISEALVRLEALSKGKPVPPVMTSPRTAPAQAIAQVAVYVAPVMAPQPVAPLPPPPSLPVPAPMAKPVAAPVHEQPPWRVEDVSVPPDHEDEPAASVSPPSPSPSPPVPSVEPDEEDAIDDDPHRQLPLVGIDPRYIQFIDKLTVVAPQKTGAFMLAQVAVADDGVELRFESEHHRRQVEEAMTAGASRDAFLQVFGSRPSKAIAGLLPGTPTMQQAMQTARDEAERALQDYARAHPAIAKAAQLFGGEVRTVKRRSDR
jgi:DNA polymerase III subunit gamma/tau